LDPHFATADTMAGHADSDREQFDVFNRPSQTARERSIRLLSLDPVYGRAGRAVPSGPDCGVVADIGLRAIDAEQSALVVLFYLFRNARAAHSGRACRVGRSALSHLRTGQRTEMADAHTCT